MEKNPETVEGFASSEIATLVRRLRDTQKRIQELTGGQVDSVIDHEGQSYLLREAQERLHESEDHLRHLANMTGAILDALPAHIALLDPKGTILTVNRSWRNLAQANSGNDSDAGIGSNYLQICDGATGDCAEEAPRIAAGIREVLSGNSTSYSLEYPCHSPEEDRWFQAIVAPVGVGPIGGAVVMHIDITHRKAAEQRLSATATSLVLSQQIAKLGSWEMELIHLDDLRANPLRWSDEMYRLFGYEPNSVAVTPDFYLQHVQGEDKVEILPRLLNLMGGDKTYSYTYPIKRSDGEIRIVHTSARVVVEEQTGKPLKLFGTVHDVTETKKREEYQLAETALLEAQLNSTLDGIIVVDPNGKKVLQNQRALEIWKIPAEFADEADHHRRFEWIASQIKEQIPFREKVRHLYLHRDETSRDQLELTDGRFIDRYSSPVLGGDGRYYGRIWVYRDVTEQKVAEKKAAEQFELITMAGRIGKLGAWSAEYPGPRITWSEEIYRIHEVSPDFQPDHESTLAFFSEPSRAKLESAIDSREPYDLELELITAKGTKKWVRTTSAVERRNSEVHRIHGILQDITERKEAELKTIFDEHRYRSLVEATSAIVWDTPASGEFTGDQPGWSAFTGQTFEELRGWGWLNAVHPDDRGETAKVWSAAVESRCRYEVEHRLQARDKTYHNMLVRAVPITGGEGNIVQWIGIHTDVTERKQLEQQFLRAQRMESIGTLAGGIAHDLNNILAPIMMAVQVLKMNIKDPQSKSILDTIEISSKRGADIVRQVLSFARGLQGERIDVQPTHLLKDIDSIIRDTFPKNISREVVFPDESWTISGDPTQIHQILLNLCVNARDAMPEGGKLSVTVENVTIDAQYASMNLNAKEGRYVCITVTDTGTGIPPGVIDRIFEPFFTTKEMGKGTGLGLSTVSAIVKSHNGFINVYSEPGRGTTFKVHLPALETTSKTSRKTTSLATLPRGNGERVLIVDDETSILTITSQTLEAFGYKTLTASDGADAVALYAQQRDKIAVVLTDMAMPVMDGTATIRALMKINPAVKIIAATGLKTEGSEAKAMNAGVKYFLAKPYTAGTLLKMLKTVITEGRKSK